MGLHQISDNCTTTALTIYFNHNSRISPQLLYYAVGKTRVVECGAAVVERRLYDSHLIWAMSNESTLLIEIYGWVRDGTDRAGSVAVMSWCRVGRVSVKWMVDAIHCWHHSGLIVCRKRVLHRIGSYWETGDNAIYLVFCEVFVCMSVWVKFRGKGSALLNEHAKCVVICTILMNGFVGRFGGKIVNY